MRRGVSALPTYSRSSVNDCFVKPIMAIARHARGETQERNQKAERPIMAMTVSQTLRLLEAAASDPAILRWDPQRQTLKKIAFQLGSMASPGETCAVLASDIDHEHQRVSIAGREPGGRKNIYRQRDVYLPDFYWNFLKDLPAVGKVFLTPHGKPYSVRHFRGGTVC